MKAARRQRDLALLATDRTLRALGEIRAFKTGRFTVREEIVERTEERRLSYKLLGGIAVRDYRPIPT